MNCANYSITCNDKSWSEGCTSQRRLQGGCNSEMGQISWALWWESDWPLPSWNWAGALPCRRTDLKCNWWALNSKGTVCKHRAGRWAALFPLPALAGWPQGRLVEMISSFQSGRGPAYPTLLFPSEKSSANCDILHCGWLSVLYT